MQSSGELMPSNYRAGEDWWESLGQKDQTSQSLGKSTLNTRWKYWCWIWNSSILVIWCEQLTHWKSPWCWERLRAEEEGIRGWDGWMASPIQWTWTWANSGKWWGTRLQRIWHDLVTEPQRDFPGGPVVKNLPYNAGDMGSIPGLGTKIPHSVEQLSWCPTSAEPMWAL